MDHVEALTLKIASALLVHFGREPRWADQCEPFGRNHSQCRDRRRTRDDHGNTSRAHFQAGLECRIISCTSNIAAAGESIYDCLQWGRRQQLSGIIDEWWIGKGPHWIIGNGRIHRSAWFVGTKRDAR